MEETLSIITSAAVGPAGAVVVLLIVLYGIYKTFIEHVIPIGKSYVDNQHQTMKDILTEHKKDRVVFQESILTLAKRQDKLEDDVEDIKTDIKKLVEKV
jgi:hypothetical protein